VAYGYNVLSDLLATDSQTVADYGENRLYDNLQELARVHNDLMGQQMADLVEVRSGPDARMAGSGATDTMVVEDMDEFATPDVQHVAAGVPMGFPLKRHGLALGWTLDWLEDATPADVAAQFQAAMTADYVGVGKAIRRALYTPTNSTVVDRFWKDRASIPVKALANADSFPIPPNPATGAAFDASVHTHYLASATWTTTFLSALIATVREHKQAGTVRVYINHNDAAAVRALTGFVAAQNPVIVQPTTATYVAPSYQQYMSESLYNRFVGLYDDAEIWVKPWVYDDYPIALHVGPGRKVLRYRQRNPQRGQFRVIFASDPRYATNHPLEARGWMREFGIAPQDRVGAAVGMIGDTTYAMPTIT
jgi:hypothetical protein